MIKISNLCKTINKKKILDNINLSFEKGDIIGIVGPNGAGKSTLFKIITTLYNSTSGNIVINGITSSCIEYPQMYEYLTGYDNLKIICDLYKIDYSQINKMIDLFDLKDFINKKVKLYSLGMKQRLYLSCAFIIKSDVIILDEPTNGLDPINIIKLKQIIKDQKDKLIIYSTHNILDINNFCDKVIFLENGKIIKECEELHNIEDVFKEVYKC